MDFSLYNVTSIRGLTSILAVVCSKNIILWLFNTASKRASVLFFFSILTTLNNEQHPCRFSKSNENGALENSADITNLLGDYFSTSMELTGGYASWINLNTE